MYVDVNTLFSNKQALTATAVSTNVYDFISPAQVGRGDPMAVVITVSTAADVANADETYQFDIQTSTDEAFTSPSVLMSKTIAGADLTLGSRHVIFLPTTNERYVRMNYTLGGTTPSVTVSAFLTRADLVDTGSGEVYYNTGYTIE